MPWQKDFLNKLIEDFQWEEDYAIRCMEANRHNHITATYHLLNKKQQRNQYMRDTFSTHRNNTKDIDQKRERMQSQGAPKVKMGATIDLNQKRKFVQEEMNRTVRHRDATHRGDDEAKRRAATIETRGGDR